MRDGFGFDPEEEELDQGQMGVITRPCPKHGDYLVRMLQTDVHREELSTTQLATFVTWEVLVVLNVN